MKGSETIAGPSESAERAGLLSATFGISWICNLVPKREVSATLSRFSQLLVDPALVEQAETSDQTSLQAEELYFEKGKFRGSFIPAKLACEMMDSYSFLTMKDSQEIYVYKEEDEIWKLDGESLIKTQATRRLGERSKVAYVNETIAYIKAKSFVDRESFDSLQVTFIPMAKGVLDTESMALQEYTPEMQITSKLPVMYVPDASCPNIKKFLGEIVRAEDVGLLEEIAGYCLYRGYPIQKSIMLVGDGANGKSTFLRLLASMLGTENISDVSLQELESNRFAKADLYRKLANIHTDLPPSAVRNPGNFKMLTGGDAIRAEKKFKDPFSFVNYAKLIFSANKVPPVEDDSNAFFRRWVIVDFPNKFDEERDDKQILLKLTTADELSGFLNLALKGLQRVLANGFSYHKKTEEIREAYLKASDSIFFFIKKCVIDDGVSFVGKDELYSAYTAFCRKWKIPATSRDKFSKDIHKHVRVENYRPTVDGERIQAWRGIKLLEGEDGNGVEGVRGTSQLFPADKFKVDNVPEDTDRSDSLDNERGNG